MNPNFWHLIDERTGEPVMLPLQRVDFRGEDNWTVYGGRPPTAPGKSGYVHVKDEDDRTREFYPQVYGLAWRLRPELHAGARIMRNRGGSFASYLAQAYQVADAGNTWRLLEAFDDLFSRYMAEAEHEPAQA